MRQNPIFLMFIFIITTLILTTTAAAYEPYWIEDYSTNTIGFDINLPAHSSATYKIQKTGSETVIIPNVDANTLLYYSMDEHSSIGSSISTVDNEEGTAGYDATATSSPIVDYGVKGQSMKLDGVDDYVSFSQITGSIGTFSIWLKSDIDLYDSTNDIIFGDSVEGEYFYSFGAVTGSFIDEVFCYQKSSQRKCWDTTRISDTFKAGKWYNIVTVWDSSNSAYNLYINGIDYGLPTDSTGTISQFSSIDWKVGTYTSQYFDGNIDEIILTDDLWTSQEVTDYYKSTIKEAQLDISQQCVDETTYYDCTFSNPTDSPMIDYDVFVTGLDSLSLISDTDSIQITQLDGVVYDSTLADKQVLELNFDKGLVDSVQNIVASNNGATQVEGISGYAYEFDGTSHISSNSNIGISGAEPRSVTGWIYLDSSVTEPNPYIFSWGETTTSNMFGLIILGGNLYFAGYGNDYDTTDTIPTDTWTHIAITYSGTNINTYINGVPTTVTNQIKTLTTTDSPLIIGSRVGVIDDFWKGKIDEFKVFNTELTAQQILDDYHLGAPDESTKFPYVSSTTAFDTTSWSNYKDLDIGYRSSTHTPDANTLAYYPLSDSADLGSSVSTVQDGTTNNYDLTASGTLTISDGLVGNSFSATGGGASYLEESTTLLDTYPADLTMSMWFKPDAVIDTSIAYDPYLISKTNIVGTDRFGLGFDNADGHIIVFYEQANDGGHVVECSSGCITSWEKNKWRLATLTWTTGGVMTLYIDGVVEWSESGHSKPATGTLEGLRIGNRYTSTTQSFDGDIDEVIITNDAWTANEVWSYYQDSVTEYNSEPSSNLRDIKITDYDEDLIAYYQFENDATDSGWYELDGTVSGNPTYTTGQTGFGNEITFDGTGDSINTGISLDSGDKSIIFTFETLVTTWACPIDNDNCYTGSANGMHIVLNSGTLGCNIGNGATTGQYLATTTTYAINTKYEIACVQEGAVLNLYKNGILVDSTSTTSGSEVKGTQSLTIGSGPRITGDEFTGDIDEVKIYSRALSSQEIYNEYLKTTPDSKTNYFGTNFRNDLKILSDSQLVPYQFVGLVNAPDDYVDFTPTSTTQLYMPFDSADAMNDESTNNNDGITYGNIANVADGYDGYGEYLDGVDDYLVVDGVDLDSETSTLTYSLWIKGGTQNNNVYLLSKGTYPNHQFRIFIGQTTGIAYCSLSNSGVYSSGIGGGISVDDDKWHLITCVYNGKMHTYIDGQLSGSSETISMVGNSNDIYIGYLESDNRFEWKGYIDELIIESTAWTADEVRNYYIQTSTPTRIRLHTETDLTETSDNYDFKTYQALYNNVGLTSPIIDSLLTEVKEVGLVAGYNLDGNAIDYVGGNDGTITGAVSTSGVFDSAMSFDGSDYIIHNLPSIGTGLQTYSLWIKTSTTSNLYFIDNDVTSSANDRLTINIQTNGKIRAFGRSQSSENVYRDTISSVNNGEWHNLIVTFDVANDLITLYVDGELDQGSQIGVFASSIDTIGTSHIGSTEAETVPFVGQIDNYKVYDRYLSSQEIKEQYESGLGAMQNNLDNIFSTLSLSESSFNSAPAVNIAYPTNTLHLSDNPIPLNYTLSDGDYDNLNCTIYLNGTVNGTQNNINTSSNNYSVFNMTGVAEGSYNMIVGCNDGTVSTNSSTINFVVDRTNPIWTIRTINTANTTTLYTPNITYLYFNDTVSDNYIFAYNLTCYYPNSTIWFTNQTINSTANQINFTRNMTLTGEPMGDYICDYYAEDDHTAKKIPDYTNIKLSDGLAFDMQGEIGKQIIISGKYKTDILNVGTTKSVDRYSFDFEYKNIKKSRTYILHSDDILYYRGQLYPYPAFITGEHWVDFNTEGATGYEVLAIDNYNYEVTVLFDKKTDKFVKINSLGGLNIVNESYTFNVYNNTAPTTIAPTLTTSSGSDTYYLQTLLNISTTVSDEENNTNNVTIIFDSPTINKANTLMTANGSTYYYDTSFTLDEIGTWTINITSTDTEGLSSSRITTFSVTQLASTLITINDGFYGYDILNLSSTTTIDALSSYGYDIYGHKLNYSTFESDLITFKTLINHSFNSYNSKNFLTINFNIADYSNNSATIICGALTNISTLKNYPYFDAMSFIVLETSNIDNRTSFINRVAQCIKSETTNKFPVYSKDYNVGLDSSYVSEWTMPYLNGQSTTAFINDEVSTIGTTSSLTRIYYDLPTDVKVLAKDYNDNKINKFRGTPITPSISGNFGQLDNNDIIVFNNLSSAQNISVNYTNNTGYDYWDYTNKKFYKDVNGTVNISIAANDASLLYVDNFSEFSMTTSLLSTLFKASSSGLLNQTYSVNEGTGDAAFSIYNAYDAKTELWNPTYVHDHLFFITYEQLNYSYNTQFGDYGLNIIAQGTNTPSDVNASLDVTTNSGILDKSFIYNAVSDYNNTLANGSNATDCSVANPWETAKIASIAAQISSFDTNIFIDGFDIGYSNTPGCFEDRIKRIVDTIKIDQGKEVICNSYTIYESIVNYCDYVMRESCFSRWDGTTSSPVYSYENMSLMIDNAEFMTNSNTPTLCMGFGAEDDYDKMMYDFHAFAVMYGADSENLFKYGQPDFQTQTEIRVPDIGTMLQTGYDNSDVNDWTRTYSNGVVHFSPYRNNTFENGEYYWFENGESINSFELDVKVQQYAAGCDNGKDVYVYLNDVLLDTITDQEAGCPTIWSTTTITIPIADSFYENNGHYTLRMAPTNRANGVGINWWERAGTETGVHSFWDTTANNPPTTESQWTAYARIGNQSKSTINFYSILRLNTTSKAGVDTGITTITQNNTAYNGNELNRNITVSSTEEYNLTTITKAIFINTTNFINATHDGVNLTVLNTSTCTGNNPEFNTTLINGYDWGACNELDNTGYWYRFSIPHLSTQEILITTFSNVAPTISDVLILPTTIYSNNSLLGYCNATDIDGDYVTYNYTWYKDGSVNKTGQSNQTQQYLLDELIYDSGDFDFASRFWVNISELTYPVQNARICLEMLENWAAKTDNSFYVYRLNNSPSITRAQGDLSAYRDDQTTISFTNVTEYAYGCFDITTQVNADLLDGFNHSTLEVEEVGLTYSNYNGYGTGLAIGPQAGYYEWIGIDEPVSGNRPYFEVFEGYTLLDTITSSSLVKGDNWTLECTASDGVNDETISNSTAVTILNSVPIVTQLNFTESVFYTNTLINGTCTATDTDTDPLSYKYDWYKNGVLQVAQSGYETARIFDIDSMPVNGISVGGNTKITGKASIIKYNISQFTNENISNVSICLYVSGIVDTPTNTDLSISRLSNKTWNSADIDTCPETQFVTETLNETNYTINSFTTGSMQCFDITDKFLEEYNNDSDILSLKLRNPNYPIVYDGSSCGFGTSGELEVGYTNLTFSPFSFTWNSVFFSTESSKKVNANFIEQSSFMKVMSDTGTFDSLLTQKYDNITLQCSVSDDEISVITNTSTITILNSLPVVNIIAPIVNETISTEYYTLNFSNIDIDSDTLNVSIELLNNDLTINSTLILNLDETNTTYNWSVPIGTSYKYLRINASEISTTELYNVSETRQFYLNHQLSPTLISAEITPTTAYTDNNLTLLVNATSVNVDNFSIHWIWYLDGSIYQARSDMTLEKLVLTTIDTIASTETIKNQNWTAEIWFEDTVNNQNSTKTNITKTINNSIPTVIYYPANTTEISGINAPLQAIVSDADNDVITYYFTVNDSVQPSQTESIYQWNDYLMPGITYNWSVIFWDGDVNISSGNLTFTVNHIIGGGSTTGPEKKAIEIPSIEEIVGPEICGNLICENNENPLTCWEDCAVTYDSLVTCTWQEGGSCSWEQKWFSTAIILSLLSIFIWNYYKYEVVPK